MLLLAGAVGVAAAEGAEEAATQAAEEVEAVAEAAAGHQSRSAAAVDYSLFHWLGPPAEAADLRTILLS